MTTKLIDSKNFTVTMEQPVTYNVDDLTSQLSTLRARLAQQVSNALSDIQTRVVDPLQQEIDAVQTLISQGKDAGADTATADALVSTDSIVATLKSTGISAQEIASPPENIRAIDPLSFGTTS